MNSKEEIHGSNQKRKLSGLFDFISKNEIWFFYAFTLLNASPIFFHTWVPSVDGPAHLYNSKLWFELFLTDNTFLSPFYELNTFNLPNVTSHVLLGLFQSLFGPLIAEKIIQLLIIIGLPLSMRVCAHSYEVRNAYLLYFVFPFTFSFHFFFGFYNFLLGLSLVFCALAYWENSKSSGLQSKQLVKLCLLATLIYFTHLSSFALLILTLLLFETLEAWSNRRLKLWMQTLIKVLCIALPGMILAFLYLNTQAETANLTERMSFYEVANTLKSVQPARGIEYGKEGKYTQWIFYSFLTLGIIGIYQLYWGKRKIETNTIKWLSLFIILLGLLFIIPDGGKASGMVTGRIALMIFLVLIFLLKYIKINTWLKVIYVFISIYISISLNKIYHKAAVKETEVARAIIEAGKQISEGSIILPIGEQDYWLRAHYSNLLGVETPHVILENYEAELNYFPIKWTRPFPKLSLHGDNWENPFDLRGADSETRPITHIFFLGEPYGQEIQGLSLSAFKEVYSDPNTGVYLYETIAP